MCVRTPRARSPARIVTAFHVVITLFVHSPAPFPSLASSCTQVLLYLYIGTQDDAADADTVARCGITHVVNVTRLFRHAFPDRLTYLRVGIDDNTDVDIRAHLLTTHEFIQAARAAGGTILVWRLCACVNGAGHVSVWEGRGRCMWESLRVAWRRV